MTTATTERARAFTRHRSTDGPHPRGAARARLARRRRARAGARPRTIIEWAVATFGERFCDHLLDGRRRARRTSPPRSRPGIDVVFLDTGYHFAETIGTRDAVEATLPVNLINDHARADRRRAGRDVRQGPASSRDPDLCCALRKVEAARARRWRGTTPGPPACAATRPTTG